MVAKNPRKPKKFVSLHADYGNWSCETNERGQVTAYVGLFSPEKLGHTPKLADREIVDKIEGEASGTARWLFNARIYRTEHPPERIRDTNEWIVRVERGRDNVDLFERQKIFARLLPDMYEKKQLARLNLQDRRERRIALPYKPKPQGIVEYSIRHDLTWERLGHGGNRFITAVTDNPELAFQAALYLHNKEFVTDKTYWDIKDQAKRVKETGNKEEFRFSIIGDRIDDFAEQFLGQTPDPTPNTDRWKKRVKKEKSRSVTDTGPLF